VSGAHLHPDDLATLADLVAERVLAGLAEERRPDAEERLLTAAEVARRFRVSPEWVRENAERLGALRLGDGPRPRLRFDPARVAEELSVRSVRGSPTRRIVRRSGCRGGAGRAGRANALDFCPFSRSTPPPSPRKRPGGAPTPPARRRETRPRRAPSLPARVRARLRAPAALAS
jgi:hypothetical protein